jgi:hypothetical protein
VRSAPPSPALRAVNLLKTWATSPVVSVTVCVAVAYSLIGVHRVVYGGLPVFVGEALPIYIVIKSLEHSAYGFNVVVEYVGLPFVAFLLKAGFVVTTVMEILTPLAIGTRWFRWSWLAVMIPFHVSTLFTMNIFFWENLVLIIVLFVVIPDCCHEAPQLTDASSDIGRKLPGNRVKAELC